jgi:hypothetical protein
MTEHKDRKVGLTLFGLFLILIGIVCALLVPLGFLPVVTGTPGTTMRMAIGSASLYLLLAARTLTLMLAWIWLICGVFSAAVMAFVLPQAMKWALIGQDIGDADAEVVYAVMVAAIFVLVGLMYIVVPGVLVLFYRSKHFRATCEARKPRRSWTEKRPRPVVVLSLTHAVLAWFFVFTGIMYNWIVPVFGVLAGGVVGALLLLASAGVSVILTPALYARRPPAWWTAMGLAGVWTVSALVTFIQVPITDFYSAMGMPQETLEIMIAMGDLTWTAILSIIVMGGAYLGYLVYAKRFYTAPPALREGAVP